MPGQHKALSYVLSIQSHNLFRTLILSLFYTTPLLPLCCVTLGAVTEPLCALNILVCKNNIHLISLLGELNDLCKTLEIVQALRIYRHNGNVSCQDYSLQMKTSRYKGVNELPDASFCHFLGLWRPAAWLPYRVSPCSPVPQQPALSYPDSISLFPKEFSL